MLVPKGFFPISAVAAKESTRYAIDGVRVRRTEEGRCQLAATDGRRIIMATWDDEADRAKYPPVAGSTKAVAGFQTTIPTKEWNEAGKLIPRTSKPILHQCLVDESSEKGKINMSTYDCRTERRITAPYVNKPFPQIEQMVPKYKVGEDAVCISVDSKLLAETLLTISAMMRGGTANGMVSVTLIVPTTQPPKSEVKGLPLLIRSQRGCPDVLGVVMPTLDDAPNVLIES